MIGSLAALALFQSKNVTGFDCTVSLRGTEISKQGVMIGFEPYLPLSIAAKVLGATPQLHPLDSESATTRNLLINGDFESTLGMKFANSEARPVLGWTILSGGCLGRYVDSFASIAQMYWPPQPGESYFVGGKSQNPGLSQIVELKPYVSSISGGKVRFQLAADLYGFSNQADSITLRITWLDGSAKVISTQSVEGPTPKERANFTKFFRRSIEGTVPLNADSAKVVLEANRAGGEWCDGYADNVTLQLSKLDTEATDVAPRTGWAASSLNGKRFTEHVAIASGSPYIRASDIASQAGLEAQFDETFHALFFEKPLKGKELVINGGFEDGPSIEFDYEPPVPVAGWKSSDGATVMRFTPKSAVAELETWYLRGKGRQFFAGGRGPKPTIVQEVDLSKWKTGLSSGSVAFSGSADFGSYQGQNDGAYMDLDWIDSNGKTIGTVKRFCETYLERRFKTKFHKQLFRGKVPAGTVKAKFTFLAVRDNQGPWADGYVDNVSLKIDLP